MLSALLIALREGLEASLVVVVIAAYLVRTGRREALPKVWTGVAAAAGLSAVVGLLVGAGAAGLSERAQEIFEGIASLAAVAVLTWMIFWMRRQARTIRSSLEHATESALASTGATALTLLAFTAVAREGLETVLFLYASFTSSTSAVESGAGAVTGLAIAIALGYGLYRGGVRLNLRRFFQVTGGLIVVVAAGMLASAVHELNEAGWLLVGTQQAWDTSAFANKTGILGSILRGLFGYRPQPTVLEAGVWAAYLIPTLIAFYGLPRFQYRRGANRAAATDSAGGRDPAGARARSGA